MLTLSRTAALALAAVLALTGTAAATDPGPKYKKVVCYETVTCTKIIEVPYEKAVTRYDHCGKPYCVTVTCYKEVEVSYTKKVPVVKYVKVCD